jgi:hypothetical protein
LNPKEWTTSALYGKQHISGFTITSLLAMMALFAICTAVIEGLAEDWVEINKESPTSTIGLYFFDKVI